MRNSSWTLHTVTNENVVSNTDLRSDSICFTSPFVLFIKTSFPRSPRRQRLSLNLRSMFKQQLLPRKPFLYCLINTLIPCLFDKAQMKQSDDCGVLPPSSLQDLYLRWSDCILSTFVLHAGAFNNNLISLPQTSWAQCSLVFTLDREEWATATSNGIGQLETCLLSEVCFLGFALDQ